MFGFFKKEKKSDVKECEEKNKNNNNEEIKRKIEKELIVHVMPKNFRTEDVGAKNARNVGIIIIFVGIFFVGFIIFAGYFVFFKKDDKNNIVQVDEKLIEEKEDLKKEEKNTEKEIATSTEEEIIEPEEEGFVATSTPEIATLTPEIATLTPEIATSTSEIIFGEDSDGDGLTDEEELLLGSDKNNLDSDNDGYEDLKELENFYNPAGEGEIADNENILKYINKTFNYQILYPKEWEEGNIGGEDSIIFKGDYDNFVQIIIQPNVENDNITEWYKKQFSVEEINYEKIFTTENWVGVENEDGTVIYLTDKNYNYVFSLSYSSGSGGEFLYKNIFKMMVKSFIIND